jgi:hypothetical protein
MHGFKDFLLHLLTITVGLFIALSLEGCVEWHAHRTLAHEAEAAMGHEIAQNLKTLDSLKKPIADQLKQLDDDMATLSAMRAHPNAQHQSLAFGFEMHSFDSVAWKTAESTGALDYMPYGLASNYADIYGAQERLVQAEEQVIEEVLRSSAPVAGQPDNWQATPAQIDNLTDRIGMLRMRLYLLSSLMNGLEKTYQDFVSHHP